MLSVIWFVALFAVSCWCFRKGFEVIKNTPEGDNLEGTGWAIWGVIVAVLNVALTVNVHVIPSFEMASSFLPQKGEPIHTLTCGLFAAGVAALLVTLHYFVACLGSKRSIRAELFARLTS